MSKKILVCFMIVLLCNIVFTTLLLAADNAKKVDITFYGFIRLDTTFDDSKTDNPDAARFALSEGSTDNERQFAMTAQNTRFGCKFVCPQENNGNLFANIELDFFDGSSDNSQKPRMRHAFFELQYPNWSLLAGQTGDVFGPLGPDSLNPCWLWLAGNIGFRRPQVRLSNTMDHFGNKITTQVSINRNIGIANGSVDTGENYGSPVLEGRVVYAFPLFTKKSTIGVEGLLGKERYNRADGISEDNYTVSQTAIGVDVLIPYDDRLSFKGELFTGSNLDAFMAGLGQGINTAKEVGIGTMGGWTQVNYLLTGKHTINAGYAQEKVDEDDVNVGNRIKNEVFYGNIMCVVTKEVKAGFEFAHFRTKYFRIADGTNNRINASIIYTY